MQLSVCFLPAAVVFRGLPALLSSSAGTGHVHASAAGTVRVKGHPQINGHMTTEVQIIALADLEFHLKNLSERDGFLLSERHASHSLHITELSH